MRESFVTLLKKDFRLCVSGGFFLLALGSLVLYSCYINLFYVKVDQEIFPVCRYDPGKVYGEKIPGVIDAESTQELKSMCEDGFSVGIQVSEDFPSKGEQSVVMASCGMEKIDHIRKAYAVSKILGGSAKGRAGSLSSGSEIIGENSKEMKNRREITAEFLFFELSAVGFLGLASLLFKEKQMGVIRIHAILPVSKNEFILSKLILFLLSDLIFAAFLTVVNLGTGEGLAALPGVLVQAGILSLIMTLTGFLCAVVLPDFKQFSLVYLVLAVFVTTPVFLTGQTGIEMRWIRFHPMYYLFGAMKDAYFKELSEGVIYYAVCIAAIVLLFLTARWGLGEEMKKEG